MAAPLNDHLDDLALTLQAAERILFCTDFDGTLVPIQDRPEDCSLDSNVRESLAVLSRSERVRVAVVSGRSLSDLRNRIDLEGLAYAGNHGLEIDADGSVFRHHSALAARPALEALIQLLRRELAVFHGVWVEDKGLSATVHYRSIEPAIVPHVFTRVDQVVRQSAKGSEFMLRSGKAVREVRPLLEWNKGSAVNWLVEQFFPVAPLVVYIGDDDTDEDAFRAVRGTGISICVGSRHTTAAKYITSDTPSVHRFLNWFVAVTRSGRERRVARTPL